MILGPTREIQSLGVSGRTPVANLKLKGFDEKSTPKSGACGFVRLSWLNTGTRTMARYRTRGQTDLFFLDSITAGTWPL